MQLVILLQQGQLHNVPLEVLCEEQFGLNAITTAPAATLNGACIVPQQDFVSKG